MSALILGASFATCAWASQTGIIFQISTGSPATWKVAVHNARHLTERRPRQPVRIEIVAFGPGLGMILKNSPVARDLIALHKSGVLVEASQGSLLRHGFALKDVLPLVHYIPSGIAEIVRRERQGWAYIRP
ncbi:MAG TPA: hypothetical protein VMV40_09365 [Acidiferrobacter sp.]|nr:hypothetical protein [Acidiferrobacter sp.]